MSPPNTGPHPAPNLVRVATDELARPAAGQESTDGESVARQAILQISTSLDGFVRSNEDSMRPTDAHTSADAGTSPKG